MKFVIRNFENGTFYRSPGAWVGSAKDATEISGIAQALELICGQALENLELVTISEGGSVSSGHRLLTLAEQHGHF